MKKVTFIIPTLYGVREPNYLDESVKSLIWHCELAKIDYTIFVAGRKNKNFDEWNNPKVFKEYIIPDDKHEEHEVAWYINKKIETVKPNEFACLYHDDLFIDDNGWINLFIQLFNIENLKIGTLGVLSHTQSIIRPINMGLYLCLYANGALFFNYELAQKVKFNESFKYECCDLDFCYEAIMQGYKNYLVAVPHRHYMVPYQESLKNLPNCMDKINDDRRRFNEKWQEKMTIEFMKTL